MLWIVLCATLAVVESGDWSATIKAQQLFHEVYGKKIEAAKTPEAKAALAKELLELAKKETDQIAKRMELEEAKQLAIAAEDAGLAIEIVRELAKLPRDDVPADLLAEAERLWEANSTITDKLEAIELYLRADAKSPLLRKKWELRIEQIKSGGTIVLRAKDAKVHAGRAAYASQFDAICYWKDPSEWFEWETSIPSARYRLEVDYAAMGAEAASEFGVAFFRVNARKPSAVLSFSLQSTGNWREFRNRVVGIVVVPHDGEYRVEFCVLRPRSQEGFINLRSVRLVPLD